MVDNLSVLLILGLPLLVSNSVCCNYAKRECNVFIHNQMINLECPLSEFPIPDILATIHKWATEGEDDPLLYDLDSQMQECFQCMFEPLPHMDELPTKPRAQIQLKDLNIPLKTRNYPCPCKWKEAWHTLLQQHLEVGCIHPSNAPMGSGAFIIPKADPTVLPQWVNDYCLLNTNTVTDSFPLPQVSEILVDCRQGKIFTMMDMMNSFFQMRMHPDDVPLTAVNTPWGLYEWVVMPMGIKNAPAMHQRRVTNALRLWIRKICYVYLDDIVIWSQSIEEHTKNVTIILNALKENKLYCNPKKTKLYCRRINFLRHRVSADGVEADEGKADRIQNWPVPRSAKQVRSFLGLVRYLANFLPTLATHTAVLDNLTRKECDKQFPAWTTTHQQAFDNIKRLAISPECLTTIDPTLMLAHKIFVTTDTSDTGSGAILSFGPSYEHARPVAYDSCSFKGAELNYPVHEKELLAIVCALSKWRMELLGYQFEVWTDHRTLKHFGSQHDLSRRQAQWMEFLSQYDALIRYIPGEKNTAADALSRLPPTTLSVVAVTMATTHGLACSRFELEDILLEKIKNGYERDPVTAKLCSAATGMHNIQCDTGFWFVDNCLFVPNIPDIRESLFRIAHDTMGHFGSEKTYALLRDAYYWPNMCRDLEHMYVPACPDCQRNKSPATRPTGPLHPLLVPDHRCDSIALDFIGPLPKDNGYDCILTITD
jgi:reverse transcriptase-like protein/integrase-like protein